jgi:hypothetical protein
MATTVKQPLIIVNQCLDASLFSVAHRWCYTHQESFQIIKRRTCESSLQISRRQQIY